MISIYMRSSSVGNYKTCPRQFFLSYVLGYKTDPKVRTDAGTIAHAVLEILAIRKLAKQKGEAFIENEIVGNLSTKFLNINHLIEQVYKYYVDGPFKSHGEKWNDEMFQHVKNCVNKAINFHDGEFSPTKREIFEIERNFDIELKQPWAKYKFSNLDGKEVEGQCHLKGTIDLITKLDDDTLEIIDWKTGARKNWQTNKPKEYDDLKEDFQLRLYHYVASLLFPQFKQIMVTIFFLKDDPKIPGGPFTLCFDDNDFLKTEDMIRNIYTKISNDESAKAEYAYFFCNKLCDFSKKTLHELNPAIPEVKAERKYLFTKPGNTLCACDHAGKVIQERGINYASHILKDPNFDIGYYNAPGGGTKDAK